MGPIYRGALSRLGYGEEVNAILDANPGRSAGVVPSEAEALLEKVTIYGTPTEVRDKLSQWYAAGADMPILMLNPDLDQSDTDLILNTFRT